MSYDGTFKNKRPLNLDLLAEMAKTHATEYDETAFQAFGPGGGASVHVHACALWQVADSSQWKMEKRDDDSYPWKASVMHNGVKFYAIFTDEQKRGLL